MLANAAMDGEKVRGSSSQEGMGRICKLPEQRLFHSLLNTIHILLKEEVQSVIKEAVFPKGIPVAQVPSLSSC